MSRLGHLTDRLRAAGGWQFATLFALWIVANGCSEPVHHETARGANLASAEFGAAPTQFAVNIQDEGRSEGPRSFAVSDDERRVFVLDAVNRRVAVFERGSWVRNLTLPANAEVEDIALLPSDRLVLMDQTGDGRLIVLDANNGQMLGETVLDGVGVSEPALAGNLLVRDDGVFVPHRGQYTRLLDAQGKTDPKRPTLPSMPTRDGNYLASVHVSGISASLILRERAGLPKNRIKTLHFEHPIAHVLAFDTDAAGKIWLVTYHIWGIGDAEQAECLLTVLTPNLEEDKHLRLPLLESGQHVARYMSVTASGGIYYLDVSDSGATVRRFQ